MLTQGTVTLESRDLDFSEYSRLQQSGLLRTLVNWDFYSLSRAQECYGAKAPDCNAHLLSYGPLTRSQRPNPI